jgi:hypothetical protein
MNPIFIVVDCMNDEKYSSVNILNYFTEFNLARSFAKQVAMKNYGECVEKTSDQVNFWNFTFMGPIFEIYGNDYDDDIFVIISKITMGQTVKEVPKSAEEDKKQQSGVFQYMGDEDENENENENEDKDKDKDKDEDKDEDK